MTEQTSRLAVIIDSTGAEKNADNLTTALGRMTQAGQRVADGAKKVTRATEDESDALSELLDRIDPVNAALNKLDKQQQQLARFKAKGFIDTDTFEQYSKKIDDTRDKLTGFSTQMGKTGTSAKQLANSMRMVPAQMTDIVVSLASGQAPLTVLLQQGGQLKDMFGGIGPAVKGLATYVGGLVNPFTLAAAAVGVLGLAYYQGSEEQDEFNKSLILTGNLIGKTSGQLAGIATRVSAATGATTGAAASVLNQLVSSGKVAGDSLERVTASIIETSKATGIATDQLVENFNDIAADPVAAITKLNDQYHFLTLATYNQIKALQDEGNQQDATRLATETYANTMNSRAKDIQDNLGSLEKGWNSLSNAAKAAWDSMLDVGRTVTPEQQLGTLEETLADAKKKQQEGGIWNRFSANASGYNIPEMEKQVEALRSQIATQGVLNNAISDYQVRQDKAVKTQQEADRVNQQYLSNADRRVKAIKQQNDFLKAGAITQEQYASNLSRINEMYKDPKQPKQAKGKSYSEDAGQKLLDQINEQSSALNAQLTTTDKLSSVTQQRIKFEQQIADIKNKSQLTADQKSLLARSDDIIQAYKAQEALQTQATTLSDYQKMQDQVRTKEEKNNDLLRDRLSLLEKAKATGKLAPGEYDQTKANIYKNTPAELPSTVKTVVGNMQPTGGQLSGTFGGMQQQYSQLDQAQQQLQAWLKAQEDAYTKAGDITTEGEARMTAIRQQAAQANQAIETQKTQIVTSATQSMMDSGLSILATGFGEQSGIYKAAFAASKAFAIAQSLVAIQQGIAMAAANPFPYNIAAMASVAAATASIVSNLSAVADVGFKTGGYTGNMGVNSVAGAVHGQEYVFDAAATKKIGVSNLDSIRKNGLDATLSKQGFGTGAQNVDSSSNNSVKQSNHIEQNFNLQGVTPDQLNRSMAEAASKGATDALKQTAMQISKGNGDVGKAMRGAYGSRRMT
jgi:phage-related minor tail protein